MDNRKATAEQIYKSMQESPMMLTVMSKLYFQISDRMTNYLWQKSDIARGSTLPMPPRYTIEENILEHEMEQMCNELLSSMKGDEQ